MNLRAEPTDLLQFLQAGRRAGRPTRVQRVRSLIAFGLACRRVGVYKTSMTPRMLCGKSHPGRVHLSGLAAAAACAWCIRLWKGSRESQRRSFV